MTTFLLLRGHSSLAFLPPSPLPMAVPAAGRFRLPLIPFSLRLLLYPSRAARAPQKTWLQRHPSHSSLIYPGGLHRRRPPPRPPVKLCPSPSFLALHLFRRRRRRPDEQRQQRVMHLRCRLWVRARRGSSAIFQTRYNPATSPTAAAPALADSPVRTMPLPSDRDHAEPIWELLSGGSRLLLVKRRLHMQGRTPSATLRNCGSLIPSRVIHTPIGSERSTLSRRATPWCVTSLSAGHRSCRPTFSVVRLLQASIPLRHQGAGRLGSTAYNRRRHRPTRP